MTDPLSLTDRNGRKFTQRRMAFLKALGETGSVAHAASIDDADRATLSTGRNTLPGFASVREAASSNESFGVPRVKARQRQICREINRLAAGAHRAIDGDPCPSDSPEGAEETISNLPASAAHGGSPDAVEKAKRNKDLSGVSPDSRPPWVVEVSLSGAVFLPLLLPL